MGAKPLNKRGPRTYALIFDAGDDLVSGMESFAAAHTPTANRLTAIGVLRGVIWKESPGHSKGVHNDAAGQ
jgi:predicted DNA-binding protein with PD1-like motif